MLRASFGGGRIGLERVEAERGGTEVRFAKPRSGRQSIECCIRTPLPVTDRSPVGSWRTVTAIPFADFPVASVLICRRDREIPLGVRLRPWVAPEELRTEAKSAEQAVFVETVALPGAGKVGFRGPMGAGIELG
jgi:hypothetical protein